MLKEFEAVAKKLEADFEATTAFSHQGVKGQSRERLVVREFLRPYLPKRFSIGSGQVVDSTGQVSKQQDIVIFDNFNYPLLQDYEDNQLFFAEQVLAIIEVKSILNNREIVDMADKATSMGSMARRPSGLVRIAPGLSPQVKGIPVVTLGFAFASSLTLGTIRDQLHARSVSQREFHGPSAILVLADKLQKSGLVAGVDRRDVTRVTVLPEGTTVQATIESSSRGEALLYFYLILMHRLEREGLVAPGPDYAAYAKAAGLTPTKVILPQESLRGARYFWDNDPIEMDNLTRIRQLTIKLNSPDDISDDEIIELHVLQEQLPKIDGGFRAGTVFVVNDKPIGDLYPVDVGLALKNHRDNLSTETDVAVLSRFVNLIRSIRRSSSLLRIIDQTTGAQHFAWKGPNIAPT